MDVEQPQPWSGSLLHTSGGECPLQLMSYLFLRLLASAMRMTLSACGCDPEIHVTLSHPFAVQHPLPPHERSCHDGSHTQ